MGVPAKALIEGDELLDYIPQRAPIVMVDAFCGIEPDGVSTSMLLVERDNLFCHHSQLDECGVIEHVAQSAALRMGYLCRQAGEEVPIGYIGAVSNARIVRRPRVGERLCTTLRVEQELMNVSLISASVEIDGEPVAECRMKIFLSR